MTAAALAAPPRRRRMSLPLFLSAIVVALLLLWTGVPLIMAVLWSLVDPDNPWSYPDFLPPALSLAQWEHVFTYSSIGRAVATSFTIAPLATILSFILSAPTAYALGRLKFRGREALKVLILLPIVLPGMVVALFLSRVFDLFGLSQSLFGLVVGHTLLSMPFMLRILATSFEAIPQDMIDAARNLGAGKLALLRHVLAPMVLPGLFAGSIFTFITSLEEFNLTFVIGTPSYETIPTVLFGYLGYHFIRTNAAVVSIILMVPSVLLLFLAERYLKTDYLSSAFGKM
ncbi:MAG TPA: ABC transporter permease [Alphaproteobacteria bacterium]|nr:ABC transporter permease [Alphaproteobacteria bacterium]